MNAQTIQQRLIADSALMAILTGGVHVVDVSPSSTPTAFSNGEMLPCARVRIETQSPMNRGASMTTPPTPLELRTPVAIWFMQQVGYAQISAAMDRVIQLLDQTQLGGAAGVRTCTLADRLDEIPDDVLEHSQSMLRFYVVRVA